MIKKNALRVIRIVYRENLSQIPVVDYVSL